MAKEKKLKGVQASTVYTPCAVSIHPELQDFIGYSMMKLAMGVRARMDELVARYGVVAPQCGILKMLHRVGPMTQVELGKYMMIDKATMVRFLDGLEEKGLAVRTTHESDRRAKVLKITAKGAKLLDKVREARIEAEETVLGPLNKEERDEFKRLVRKMAVQAGS